MRTPVKRSVLGDILIRSYHEANANQNEEDMEWVLEQCRINCPEIKEEIARIDEWYAGIRDMANRLLPQEVTNV